MNQLSDELLIDELLKGKTEALDILYIRYGMKLFVFCDYLIGSQRYKGSEDIVHEVFIQVIRSAHKYDVEKASFRTWLYRIARNKCYDELRRNRRNPSVSIEKSGSHPAYDSSKDLANSLADPDQDVEDVSDRMMITQAVQECIEVLDDQEERLAFLMYFLGGKVYREIAEVLSCSLSTAKNRVHHARGKLRRCLEGLGMRNR